MQVNENGLLSFLTEIPSYFNVQFPLDYPLIAALYSDVDARGAGAVWHRTTRDPTLLARAQRKLEMGFPDSGFMPEELVVVTWDRVGYYEAKGDLVSNEVLPVFGPYLEGLTTYSPKLEVRTINSERKDSLVGVG